MLDGRYWTPASKRGMPPADSVNKHMAFASSRVISSHSACCRYLPLRFPLSPLHACSTCQMKLWYRHMAAFLGMEGRGRRRCTLLLL